MLRAKGYAGIAIQGDRLAIWWKSGTAVPDAVDRAIATARRTVQVRLEPARYSQAELRTAANAITDQIEAAKSPSPLSSVEVPVDGSGLVVGVDAKTRLSVGRTTGAKLARAGNVTIRPCSPSEATAWLRRERWSAAGLPR